MQIVKNLPFIFLTLLAGCTEHSPGTTRVAGTDRDPIVETQTPVTDQPSIGPELYKVIKTVDGVIL